MHYIAKAEKLQYLMQILESVFLYMGICKQRGKKDHEKGKKCEITRK